MTLQLIYIYQKKSIQHIFYASRLYRLNFGENEKTPQGTMTSSYGCRYLRPRTPKSVCQSPKTEVTHWFTPDSLIYPYRISFTFVGLLDSSWLLHFSFCWKITNLRIAQKHPRDWHWSLTFSGTAAVAVRSVPRWVPARVVLLRVCG